MKTSPWTPERIDRLKELWRQRHSANQIARILDCGLSRCAVLAKIYRLGLSTPREMKSDTGRSAHLPVRRVVGAWTNDQPPASVFGTPPSPRNIEFLELTAIHCRFAVNETVPFLFCGHERRDGSSYCTYHHALTHVPAHPPNARDGSVTQDPQPIRSNTQHIADGAGSIFRSADKAA